MQNLVEARKALCAAAARLQLFFLFALLCFIPCAHGQATGENESSKLTSKRLGEKPWWPTKPAAVRSDFVGTAVCATCHKQLTASQQATPMAHAAEKAPNIALLQANPTLTFTTRPFETTISTNHSGSTYSVTGSGDSMAGQVTWSIGYGVKGQTFLVQYLGILFESQLSYFPSIHALDITPEHPPEPSQLIERAFGAPLSDSAAKQCFSCHTTISMVGGRFDPQHATPGVTCEACHGPGSTHVKLMRAGEITRGMRAIVDPSSFSPVRMVDFCGACHRAPADVLAAGDFIQRNVRFQPYRLSKSRCWAKPDARITCVACHNPHESLVRDVDSYDSKCLACHQTQQGNLSPAKPRTTLPTERACPVSSEHCVSCHMPKFQDSQFHGSFTDHDIRIVHSISRKSKK